MRVCACVCAAPARPVVHQCDVELFDFQVDAGAKSRAPLLCTCVWFGAVLVVLAQCVTSF